MATSFPIHAAVSAFSYDNQFMIRKFCTGYSGNSSSMEAVKNIGIKVVGALVEHN